MLSVGLLNSLKCLYLDIKCKLFHMPLKYLTSVKFFQDMYFYDLYQSIIKIRFLICPANKEKTMPKSRHLRHLSLVIPIYPGRGRHRLLAFSD